jgi:hypothetical protein
VHISLCAALFYVDNALQAINGPYIPEFGSIRQMQGIAVANLGVLARITVAVDWALCCPADAGYKLKAR